MLISSFVKAQDEVTIFNSNGDAAYYIDYDANVIYTFNGNPVSYLNQSINGGYNVYSFNGDHMGWYERGILWDHSGKIEGFVKGAITNVMPKMEPMKEMKKMVPMKMMAKMEPMKPMFTNNFATTPIDNFLNKGLNSSNAFSSRSENKVDGPYDKPYTANDFVPTPLYHPPFEAIEKAANAYQQRYNQQQEQINKLLEAGYTYDIEDNVYYSPENWETIDKARKGQLERLRSNFYKSDYFLSNDKIKNGRYLVYFIRTDITHPRPNVTYVQISNNKLQSIDYPGHKMKFKNKTKFENGMCTAQLEENPGFFSNSTIYPEMRFCIIKAAK